MSDEIQTEALIGGDPAPAPEPAVEKPKESFDESFDRIAREVTSRQERGPDGRFKAKVDAPEGAPEVPQVPGSPQAAPPDPVPPVIEAPQSLPADVKAAWN